MDIFEILYEYREGFLSGLGVTIKLCAIVWLSGLMLGSILGVLGTKWGKFIGLPSRMATFILSGTPILVFLFWLHYPLQEILRVRIDPFVTASVALSTINIFSVSEVVRSAIADLPTQYIEAAKVCGVPPRARLVRIELPLIFRHVISPFLFIQVNVLHLTLFASLISVEEIFRVCQRINAQIYRPIEIYTALALFFLIVSLPLNGLAIALKKRFARDISEK
jgi:His/Glu/Gln/Arg/opine family amino acid ABC transporter permease subunit